MQSAVISDPPRPQPTLLNERVQAKMQEMGISNVPDAFPFQGDGYNNSTSQRPTEADQNPGLTQQLKLHRHTSASWSRNKRWHGNSLKSASTPNLKDDMQYERGYVGVSNDHDLFDTDIENVDSTVSLSDIGNAGVGQEFSPFEKASGNALDQTKHHDYYGVGSFQSTGRKGDRGQHIAFDAPANNGFTNNIEEGLLEGVEYERNNETSPRLEGLNGVGISYGLAEDSDHDGSLTRSKESQQIQVAERAPSMDHPIKEKKKAFGKSIQFVSDRNKSTSKYSQVDPLSVADRNLKHQKMNTGLGEHPEHGSLDNNIIPPGARKTNEKGVVINLQHRSQTHQGQSSVAAVTDRLVHKGSEGAKEEYDVSAIQPSGPIDPPTINESGIGNRSQVSTVHGDRDIASYIPSHKHRIDLDYNPVQLREMTYDRLSHEDFDHFPQATNSSSLQSMADLGLSTRLQNLYELKDCPDLLLQRKAFFSNLKIDQYEECGDLIVEKFSDMMSQYKNVRQQKRLIARTFESEIATWEERVQAKKKGVDQDLGRLRQAGENIVKGKRA